MKKTFIPISVIRIVSIILFMGYFSLSFGSNNQLTKKKDAWTIVVNALSDNGMDVSNLSVIDTIKSTVISKTMIVLNKEFKVKEPPQIGRYIALGDLISQYMEHVYAKKHKEEFDFYKVQYSTNCDSIESFLKKYPESGYKEELNAKMECLKQIAQWRDAKGSNYRFKNCFTKNEANIDCRYQGYNKIADEINLYKQSMRDWNTLVRQHRADGTNCSVWQEYAEQYKDVSPYSESANDSMDLCRKHYMWNRAISLGTIESYQAYVDAYPTGGNAIKAKKKIDDMTAWSKVVKNRTYENMSQYYKDFPEGDSVDVAAAFLKKAEEKAWNDALAAAAKKKKSTEPYDDFIKKYPNGYYSNDARSKRNELIFDRYDDKSEASIKDLEVAGNYSRDGYSLLCFGNISKGSSDITVHMIGNTSISETIPAKKSKWVVVKNGTYRIFVTSSNGSKWNGHGTVTLNNKIYCGAWYTYTEWNGISWDDIEYDAKGLPSLKRYDSAAAEAMVKEVSDRASEELVKIIEMLSE